MFPSGFLILPESMDGLLPKHAGVCYLRLPCRLFSTELETILSCNKTCSVHVAMSILDFFEEKGIAVLGSPARDPDLNIIENLWSMLNEIVHQRRNL